MQTEASKTRSFEIAFVLDGASLKQLEGLLREVGEAVEYQVKFSDGHGLQFHGVDDVLRQPNSRTRSIVSLIAGVTARGKQSVYVVLKDPPYKSTGTFGVPSSSPSVEYTITGTHKNVIYLGDKLDEWTNGIRQWYSALYRGVLSFALAAAVVLGPIWLWNSASRHLFSPAFLKAHDWLQLVGVGSLWVCIYWTFKLFPRATFAIGQGTTRHQFFKYLRNAVLGAFGLSLLASLLANWLTQHQ